MSLMCYHALQSCDVVVYDALVNPDILRWVKVGAELEYAGKRGGKLGKQVQYCLGVPAEATARVQEVHILIGHVLCEIIDRELSTRKSRIRISRSRVA